MDSGSGFFIGGSFIDDLAFMILVTPILYLGILKLCYDPVSFMLIIVIIGMIGVVIPPVAIKVLGICR